MTLEDALKGHSNRIASESIASQRLLWSTPSMNWQCGYVQAYTSEISKDTIPNAIALCCIQFNSWDCMKITFQLILPDQSVPTSGIQFPQSRSARNSLELQVYRLQYHLGIGQDKYQRPQSILKKSYALIQCLHFPFGGHYKMFFLLHYSLSA